MLDQPIDCVVVKHLALKEPAQTPLNFFTRVENEFLVDSDKPPHRPCRQLLFPARQDNGAKNLERVEHSKSLAIHQGFVNEACYVIDKFRAVASLPENVPMLEYVPNASQSRHESFRLK